MSTEIPGITELHGELRVVPLDGLPEGVSGAALVDERGTEIERIVAPAVRFDADAVFRRLDTRRSVLAGYVERLQAAVNANAVAGPATMQEARWIFSVASWHLAPWLVGAVQAWFLWRLGSSEVTRTLGIVEFLLALIVCVAVFRGRKGPAELPLLLMGGASLLGVLVVALWAGAPEVFAPLLVGLLAATTAQGALALWLKSRWAPLPVLEILDYSQEPAALPGTVRLCVQMRDGRAIPSIGVRYDTAEGALALYTLLPLARLDRSPAKGVGAVAEFATYWAQREQRNAALVTESRERLVALEESMRQLDG